MKPANGILSNLGTTVFEVMSRLAIEHDSINLGQGFPDRHLGGRKPGRAVTLAVSIR